MPIGPYCYLRCMNKINLANTTYFYIMSISENILKNSLMIMTEKTNGFGKMIISIHLKPSY